MMILENLKEATKDLHKATEALNFTDKIINGDLTLSEYCALLQRNYHFHLIVESVALRFLGKDALDRLEYANRIKTEYLKADLSQLDQDHKLSSKLSVWDSKLITADQAIGAVYVAEGSTLGGKVILNHLSKNYHIFPYVKSFHFYNCYGRETGKKWRRFCEVLNSFAEIYNEDEILRGAKQAFEIYINTSRTINYSPAIS